MGPTCLVNSSIFTEDRFVFRSMFSTLYALCVWVCVHVAFFPENIVVWVNVIVHAVVSCIVYRTT